MTNLLPIILVLCSYLLGSVNASIIVCHVLKEGDIRTKGSGNAGMTNTMRSVGKGAAIAVLLFDVLKGVAAVVAAQLIFGEGHMIFVLLCALAVMLGHIFPVYFGFKGGKGVATAIAVIASIYGAWPIALIMAAIAIVLIITTKYMSLSVLLTVSTFPFLSWWLLSDPYFIVFSVIVTLLLYVMHRENIKRLLDGTENKMKWSKS